MRRFPSPISSININPKYEWRPGEYYSMDLIPMGKRSVRDYTCYLLLVDKATDRAFKYFLKGEGATEFLSAFEEHLEIHHKGQHPKVVDCTNLLSDNGKQATSKKFIDFLKKPEINIHMHLSAPYKQVQNRSERFHQTIKGGVKSCMAYNNAPTWYW